MRVLAQGSARGALAGASHTRVHLEAHRRPDAADIAGGRNVSPPGCARAVTVPAVVAVGEDGACDFWVCPRAAAISFSSD